MPLTQGPGYFSFAILYNSSWCATFCTSYPQTQIDNFL